MCMRRWRLKIETLKRVAQSQSVTTPPPTNTHYAHTHTRLHTLPSIHHPNLLLPWQRWQRNYVSLFCRYQVSLHVISCLQCAMWHVDYYISFFSSYIRKESRAGDRMRGDVRKAFNSSVLNQWGERLKTCSKEVKTNRRDSSAVIFPLCVLKTTSIGWQRRATTWQTHRTGTCRTGTSLLTGNINLSL